MKVSSKSKDHTNFVFGVLQMSMSYKLYAESSIPYKHYVISWQRYVEALQLFTLCKFTNNQSMPYNWRSPKRFVLLLYSQSRHVLQTV